jgi:hypothetical protein
VDLNWLIVLLLSMYLPDFLNISSSILKKYMSHLKFCKTLPLRSYDTTVGHCCTQSSYHMVVEVSSFSKNCNFFINSDGGKLYMEIVPPSEFIQKNYDFSAVVGATVPAQPLRDIVLKNRSGILFTTTV